MNNDEVARLLNLIGQILAEDQEYSASNALLIAELDIGFVGLSIFRERDVDVLYRDPDIQFTETLLDLWEEWDPDKRWAEMEYVVRDGKFDASFIYADDIVSDEDELKRRDRIVARHFGNKPIIYPPLPGDDHFEL